MIQMWNKGMPSVENNKQSVIDWKELKEENSTSFSQLLQNFHSENLPAEEKKTAEQSDDSSQAEKYHELLKAVISRLQSIENPDAFLEEEVLLQGNGELLAALSEDVQAAVREIMEKENSVETSLIQFQEDPALETLIAVILQAEADEARGKDWPDVLRNELTALVVHGYPDVSPVVQNNTALPFEELKNILFSAEDVIIQADPAINQADVLFNIHRLLQGNEKMSKNTEEVLNQLQGLLQNKEHQDTARLLPIAEYLLQLIDAEQQQKMKLLQETELLLLQDSIHEPHQEKILSAIKEEIMEETEDELLLEKVQTLLQQDDISLQAQAEILYAASQYLDQRALLTNEKLAALSQFTELVHTKAGSGTSGQHMNSTFRMMPVMQQNHAKQFSGFSDTALPGNENITVKKVNTLQAPNLPMSGKAIFSQDVPLVQQNIPLAQQQLFTQMFTPQASQQTARPNQEALLKQFETILARSSIQQLQNGMQQITMKLHPVSLGRLDITIQQVNGVMTARIMASTSIAKDMLDSQLHHLKQSFQGQNLQVERIEITQQQNQIWKDAQEEHRSRQQEKNRQSAEEQLDEDEEEKLEFDDFLQATINTEI